VYENEGKRYFNLDLAETTQVTQYTWAEYFTPNIIFRSQHVPVIASSCGIQTAVLIKDLTMPVQTQLIGCTNTNYH
jgi:hypothetical protein